MARIREWFTRLVGTFTPARRDADLERELRAHLEMALDAGSAASPAAARTARLEAGGMTQAMDALRDQRSVPWLEHLVRDLRHATRLLARSPVFTAAAALSLALAVGANTAIFAVVERVVLNPLPYPDSERIVRLDHVVPRFSAPTFDSVPPGLYFQYRDRLRSVSAAGAYLQDETTLTSDGTPERIPIARVTSSLAAVLRIGPVIGRWFTGEEDAPGAPPTVVLSHGLWVRRYGADRGVVGRSITLGGVPTLVVGVMPADFAFPVPRTDAWIPDRTSPAAGFGIFTHSAVVRLREGASLTGLRAEMEEIIADLPRTQASSALALSLAREGFRAQPLTLKEATVGDVAGALWILLASVGLVLLVACTNVANLFLVRSESRQREVAVRRALGAGRGGIARYFLAESLILAALGGALGIALGWTAVRALVALGPVTLPRLHEVRLDSRAVAVAAAISLLAALLFAAIPLVHRAPLVAALHDGGRSSTASRGRHRVRRLLMGVQVAVALILLIASGLMFRSFQKLRAVDPGYDARSVLTFRIGLPATEYRDRRTAVAAHTAILDRLTQMPGVTAVSAATCLPLVLGGCLGNSVFVERDMEARRPAARTSALFHGVAAGYAEAMGIALLRGRHLTRDDIERGEPNVVVDKAFADAYFPGVDPLGQRIASSRPPAQGPPIWVTIVGVVSNTVTVFLSEPKPAPKVYMPMSIAGGPEFPAVALIGPDVATMNYVVRSRVEPLSLAATARRAVDLVDAKLALANVGTLEQALTKASAQMAFTMVLLALAAGVTLLLGVVGIYGVMSYIVSQRRGEIGIRLALGAKPASVVGMIVQQGGAVTVAGLAIGAAAAAAGSRFIASLLFDVSARDPGIFAAATAVLFSVALLACWLPARHAARVDPIEALRAD